MDARELAAGNRQVAPRRGPTREHHRVVAREQLGDRHVDPHVDTGSELGSLCGHLREPPLEVPLLQLELGNAVAQQTTDAIGALVHDDVVPGPGELLRGREPRRARTDDRHAATGAH